MTAPPPSRTATAARETIVKVADWAADRGAGVLVTLGLGSCVAIMLYDPVERAGGMAHVLLPSKSLARDVSNPAKFPETAVPLLVERVTRLGADPRRLVAKLAGGASMFAQLMTPGTVQMGERNIAAARNALRAASIPLVREAVGGEAGRSVRFHLADGRVEIRSVGQDATLI
ncbi:MAG: chemotaxis protein CheD [Gemmatimonadales bacterium]